jgi:protein-tyrosine phosphatase
MIDIHNHILPGIDDGSTDLEESLQMCRIAAEDGVEIVVATPHSFNGQFITDPLKIRKETAALNNLLREKSISLKVVPGMEVRITPELPQLLSSDKVLPLNDGRYVLMEFHPVHVPAGFENLAKMLCAAGYRIVLAHPEKNHHIQRHPRYLYNLISALDPWELLVQISADSIAAAAGRVEFETAKVLLTAGLAHVIATDAHSTTRRPPLLSVGEAAAAEIVEPERARQMVFDVPRAVLGVFPFPEAWEPQLPKQKRFSLF